MQRPSSRYDQRALTLIDACLAQGRFTDEAVSEIIQSFGRAIRWSRPGPELRGLTVHRITIPCAERNRRS